MLGWDREMRGLRRRIARRARLSRRMLVVAAVPAVLGIAHHADHITRWYVGWPLAETVDGFSFSLPIYLFVLPRMYLTARGRPLATYWLVVAIVGLLTVVPVHLGPEAGDSVLAIYGHYATGGEGPIAGIVAVAILVGLMVSLVVLAATAFRTRRLLAGS